jgi:sporulation protein YlmC with PRC-barrel domain
MPTPSIETVRAWLGRVMIDRDGHRIGEITDVYLDNETGRPEWAVVRTGLFGLRSTFAPLAEATEVGDQVQVRHERTQVKDAPNIEPDGQLSAAEEAELYRHYGLDYDAIVDDDSPHADESGGNPARQVAGSRIDEPAGSTGAATFSGSSSGGRADTQSDSPPGSRTDQPDIAVSDQELLAEPVQRKRRGDPGPDEAPVAGTTESAPLPPQDQFPVGEGMSQPFVYETPGQPDVGQGTRRRQPGQVRLRRYLVTEVVTQTESGERHEVRVQSEPISADEVDAVTGPLGKVDEPRTGVDDNDWFRAEGDPQP